MKIEAWLGNLDLDVIQRLGWVHRVGDDDDSETDSADELRLEDRDLVEIINQRTPANLNGQLALFIGRGIVQSPNRGKRCSRSRAESRAAFGTQ